MALIESFKIRRPITKKEYNFLLKKKKKRIQKFRELINKETSVLIKGDTF